ncbi:MAG: Rne/Rng family ribonuclease [Desulfobacterales bacterium]|nr:Rne/Rng family ribonuclease [Desulfobacterales bacterium]
MSKQLVINAAGHETRVALLEDGTVAEFFVVRKNDQDIAGNIYKGRVQRVLPGMQSAFVDIGLKQAAFIHVANIIGKNEEFDRLLTRNGDSEESLADAGVKDDPCDDGQFETPIEDLIRDNQELMVQVVKPPMGTKGARITTYISLPGRFLVLMPNSDHIGISRRIENENERSRLKALVASLRKGNSGFIVRTAAEGEQEEKIAAEMNFLVRLWEKVNVRFNETSAPALLRQEIPVSLRAVRDLLTYEADKLVIDSAADYEAIISFLEEFAPNRKSSVELYSGAEPIFDVYNLEGDLSRALKKKIWLKSGGYIVIEHTEALVAIDVNTGRYVGKHNLEETILKTNLEAVKEIVCQIRLRDIGGIIIIDFIDMKKKSNQDKVFSALKEALKKDRSKTHVLPVSEMGLIQMTRKRSKKSLNRILCESCFYCEGNGYLISKQTICYNLYREVLRDIRDFTGDQLTLRVNPQIAEFLHGEENHLMESLERSVGKQIVIYPNPQFHMEEFEIYEQAKKPAG